MARSGVSQSHGIPLDPRTPVGSLPFAYRQMTEICKALMGDVRVLILDEPTSALTGDEEQILFDAIRTVTARGVGVIYVTHRLNEVFRISQRVTVFRDGANAGIFTTRRNRHEAAGRGDRRAGACGFAGKSKRRDGTGGPVDTATSPSTSAAASAPTTPALNAVQRL